MSGEHQLSPFEAGQVNEEEEGEGEEEEGVPCETYFWESPPPPILTWVTRLTDSGGQITNLEFDFWRASLTWLSFGWLPVGSASQLARLSFQPARNEVPREGS